MNYEQNSIDCAAIFYLCIEFTNIIDILRHRTILLTISLILNNIVYFLRDDTSTMTYFNSNSFNTATVGRNSDKFHFGAFEYRMTGRVRMSRRDVMRWIFQGCCCCMGVRERTEMFLLYPFSHLIVSSVWSNTMFCHRFYSALNIDNCLEG